MKILIVGDWVIDEYWLVGAHRAELTVRPGKQHSRALQTVDSAVRTLGGAGLATSLLARTTFGFPFEITAAGVWRRGDGPTLAAMLNPDFTAGNTPHALEQNISAKKATEALFSQGTYQIQGSQLQGGLIHASQITLCNLSDAPNTGTTRVVRLYDRTTKDPDFVRRVDWRTDGRAAIPRHNKLAQGFDYILVRDIHGRTVSPKLVDYLIDNNPSARWHVASRSWLPDWFETISDRVADLVDLILIPELAAEKASRLDGFSCIRRGRPSQIGMKKLDALAKKGEVEYADEIRKRDDELRLKKLGFPNATLVVAPRAPTILARLEPGRGFLHNPKVSKDYFREVPRASSLFPFLSSRIISDLTSDTTGEGLTTRMPWHLASSIVFTTEWMKEERERLRNADWQRHDRTLLVRRGIAPAGSTVERFDNIAERMGFDWEVQRAEWEMALSPTRPVQFMPGRNKEVRALGYVCDRHKDGTCADPALHLFRATTHVDEFVCVERNRRAELQGLVEHARRLKEGAGKKRNRAVLILANPGMGKTFLVTKLADTVGLRFREFNITQMHSREDILRCFRDIVVSQDRNPNDDHLVFIDEINATVEGYPVYQSFLTALDEGTFFREGRQFRIKPCLWVFAGTGAPGLNNNDKRFQSPDAEIRLREKWPDFQSRLTFPLIDWRDALETRVGPDQERAHALGDDKYEERQSYLVAQLRPHFRERLLEAQYVAASLIVGEYPDVKRVSGRLLAMLSLIACHEGCGMRDQRGLIRALENVHGEVPFGSLGDRFWQLLREDLQKEVQQMHDAINRGRSWPDSWSLYQKIERSEDEGPKVPERLCARRAWAQLLEERWRNVDLIPSETMITILAEGPDLTKSSAHEVTQADSVFDDGSWCAPTSPKAEGAAGGN